MDEGTYAAASNGVLQFRKLEVVNNNLANTNTPGFKQQIIQGKEQSFDDTFAKALEKTDPYAKGDHKRGAGVSHVKTVTDFSPGPIKNTGNELDVAIRDPKAFFVVNTPQGPQYTRAGNFTLNGQGELVTPDGYQVSGDGGAINVNGPGARIGPDGGVVVNGSTVAKLQVVRFDDPQVLNHIGGNRFALQQGKPQPTQVDPDLVPQALEMSNVSAISSVIDLINANRAFDMYTKSARTIDDLNQSAIGQVGRSGS